MASREAASPAGPSAGGAAGAGMGSPGRQVRGRRWAGQQAEAQAVQLLAPGLRQRRAVVAEQAGEGAGAPLHDVEPAPLALGPRPHPPRRLRVGRPQVGDRRRRRGPERAPLLHRRGRVVRVGPLDRDADRDRGQRVGAGEGRPPRAADPVVGLVDAQHFRERRARRARIVGRRRRAVPAQDAGRAGPGVPVLAHLLGHLAQPRRAPPVQPDRDPLQPPRRARPRRRLGHLRGEVPPRAGRGPARILGQRQHQVRRLLGVDVLDRPAPPTVERDPPRPARRARQRPDRRRPLHVPIDRPPPARYTLHRSAPGRRLLTRPSDPAGRIPSVYSLGDSL